MDAMHLVEVVKSWAAVHPVKTRQSVFLERYPDARLDSQDALYACPADVYGNSACPKHFSNPGNNINLRCCDCRYKFWKQVIE